MAGWRECALGDLVDVRHGYAFLGEHFVKAGSQIVLTPGNFYDEGGFKHKGDSEKWYNGPIPDGYVTAPSRVADVAVSVPPLSVQRRIARILSAYDDLIENSRRRIRILETMARALFCEWFVQFRFPGHDRLARVSSPLGEIPQGWKVKKLGDILELKYGKALKKGATPRSSPRAPSSAPTRWRAMPLPTSIPRATQIA